MRTKKHLTKRITRQQLKRDRFVDTTFDWAIWARENVRTVALAAGVLVLLVAGVLLYRGARASESRAAALKFQQVWQAYSAGNFKLAANDFKQFLNRYGSSEYADEATVYLADSYMQAGDYPAVIKVLQGFRERHGDSPLSYAATNLLAAAYEASGNLVKAAEVYHEARGRARYDYERVAALMDLGRVYRDQQAKDKAAEAYREIIEKYPRSPSAAEAKVRLAELTAEPLTVSAEAQGAAKREVEEAAASRSALTPAGGLVPGSPTAGVANPADVIFGEPARGATAEAQAQPAPAGGAKGAEARAGTKGAGAQEVGQNAPSQKTGQERAVPPNAPAAP